MGVSKRQVRWKQGSRYRYGFIGETLVTGKDGSVKVTERHTEATRSLHPAVLQVADRGPRGGKRWIPLVIDDDTVPAERGSWEQMDLFGSDAA